MEIPENSVQELQQTSAVIEKLAANPDAFKKAYQAFTKSSPVDFEGALHLVGIVEYCHIVCTFFCRKHCVGLCRKFCPQPIDREVDAEEMLAYAKAVGPLFRDEKVVRTFLEIMQEEDVKAWQVEIKRHKLEPFCIQLCALLFSWRCRKSCHELCPPKPQIIIIGNIPVSQIDPSGFGNGPNVTSIGGYPGHVPPNPTGGTGNHPFGGDIGLHGVFNTLNAVEYLVEVSSTGPAGTYHPILVGPQSGVDGVPPQLPLPPFPEPMVPPPSTFSRDRSQSPGTGWFKVDEITDSDGGRAVTGVKLLLTWPTSSLTDGIYYLRLQVRDSAMNVRISNPQVVQLDNTWPLPLPRPFISLQLKKPDGTLAPLKCGQVKKGDGLIQITILAFDPNFSAISVTAKGNSGLTVDIKDTGGTSLSKTYNGNLADQGYPVPTSFLWDPWNDPNIVPCCYLVYIVISDRTIVNNGSTGGGHSNDNWEAIEIGV